MFILDNLEITLGDNWTVKHNPSQNNSQIIWTQISFEIEQKGQFVVEVEQAWLNGITVNGIIWLMGSN